MSQPSWAEAALKVLDTLERLEERVARVEDTKLPAIEMELEAQKLSVQREFEQQKLLLQAQGFKSGFWGTLLAMLAIGVPAFIAIWLKMK